MKNLRSNGNFLFIALFLAGCATSSYKVLSPQGLVELSVSPDRVIMECEWLHDADIEGLYGFMIHVLDDENTVLTVSQGNTLDKESCYKRIKKIGKILKEGNKIYIAGMGGLEERHKDKYSYTFPNKGTFNGNSRTLQFMVITNEHGSCYDAYSGDEPPCPR